MYNDASVATVIAVQGPYLTLVTVRVTIIPAPAHLV